ncbi:unnamed protein product [Symbiodinium sp. CCMP2592]|nr:unnamed protein product [Symbiodinium sp. CCMP2592]
MQSYPGSPDRLEQGLKGAGKGGEEVDPWSAFLQQQQLRQQQQARPQQPLPVGVQRQASGVVGQGTGSDISSLGESFRNHVPVPPQPAPAVVNPVPCNACSAQVVGSVPQQGAVQSDLLREMQVLISRMSPQQAQAAQTVLNEQLMYQARGVPDRFGERPVHPDARQGQFAPGAPTGVLPCQAYQLPQMNQQSFESRDAFSRADKWLGQPPSAGVEKWTSREVEIAGFSDYIVALQSWAALASMTFTEEISCAVKWPEVIWQQTLSEDQKVRSVRLFGILRTAFAGHARAMLMIQAFGEGLPLDNSVADPVRFLGNTSCDFELLRQLGQQFSLRSRAEALSMRFELLGRIFSMKSSEMSAATVVGDVIRKLDIEGARFSKPLGTLPSHLDRQGLSIGDGDMLVIPLRSLPEEAKKHVLHHSAADTYQTARLSALKYEQQQRFELFDLTKSDGDDQYDKAWYDNGDDWYQWDGSWSIAAVNEVKCFACDEYGHVSHNCKKGKMYELVEESKESNEGGLDDATWADDSWHEGWDQWDSSAGHEAWGSAVAETSKESKPVENLQLSAVIFAPLLVNEILEDPQDCEWWLLDSGAGVSVLSESAAAWFGIDVGELRSSRVQQGFSAANGSPVKMLAERTIRVEIFLELPDGTSDWREASMNVWIGDTNHNIISTTMLCHRGWTFSQSREGIHLASASGACAKEIVLFCNVPWVRLRPVVHPESPEGELCLAPLTPQVPLVILHITLGASTVVADFFFLSSTGEERREVRSDNLRVLVMVERMSSMIGAIVTSDNLVASRTDIVRWLREFGLESGTCSILMLTDAEEAVSDLVAGASDEFVFQVRKAGPQCHESIGVAERGVRKIKESLQTLRSDLNHEGLDICFNHVGFSAALTYLCGSLNRFSKAHGSELAPCDMPLQRPTPKGAFTLFSATVLAELPQSIKDLGPNLPRFTEAAFLYPVLGSQAIRVAALIRLEGRLELKVFNAKSVKVTVPLTWRLELVEGVIAPIGGGPRVPPVLEHREVLDPPVSVRGPASGPPVEWLRRHGYTARCPACSNLQAGRRAGQKHGRTCQQRYAHWLRESVAGDGAAVAEDRARVVSADPIAAPDQSGQEMAVDVGDPSVPVHQALTVQWSEGSTGLQLGSSAGHASFGGGSESRGVKRMSDVEVVDLENEIRDSGPSVPRMIEGIMWASDAHEPVVLNEVVTRPEVFDEGINSIRYESSSGNAAKPKFESVPLGGTRVHLWCPDGGIDDSTLEELPGDLVFAGMKEEICNLENCRTGRIIGSEEVDALKRKHPGMCVIQSRWVCARKNAQRVRSRIVAKDIANGSARKQGFSSPTPSLDSLMLALIMLATRDMRGCGADIGHAFMNSPLEAKTPVILKLPLSVSLSNGLPAFFFLYCALNGLREASLAWLRLLTGLIRPLGLNSCEREPCLFTGWVSTKVRETAHGGRAIVIAYVDDLLIITDDELVEQAILSAISKRLHVKITGRIFPSSAGGGSLTFLGRCIRRWPGSSVIELSIDKQCLEPCFSAYGITKGSQAVPDVASLLEKSGPELTPEAYSRFRRALGRLLWYAQTRQDIKLMLTLIATQQSKPTSATESALRAVLRFLKGDEYIIHQIPSASLDPEFLNCSRDELLTRVHVFADASYAPYRFLERRGITGGAITFAGSAVRLVAKTQSVVCLSSCESELHALQLMAQECVAFMFSVNRVLASFGEASLRYDVQLDTREDEDSHDPDQESVAEILTDSQSAVDLLKGEDLPRRSRHIEIRIAWLREHLRSGRIQLRWLRGTVNPADLLTKCLPTRMHVLHRERLGFVAETGHASALFALAQLHVQHENKTGSSVALLEVCCSADSELSRACCELRIPYVGITANAETTRVFEQAARYVSEWKLSGLWVHVHTSTPCAPGSPLKRFSESKTEADFAWEPLCKYALKYLQLGDGRSFELPYFNDLWKRHGTQKLLTDACLIFHVQVHLCATGMMSNSGLPIGKQLCFACSHEVFSRKLRELFGTCRCSAHASFADTDYTSTAQSPFEAMAYTLASSWDVEAMGSVIQGVMGPSFSTDPFWIMMMAIFVNGLLLGLLAATWFYLVASKTMRHHDPFAGRHGFTAEMATGERFAQDDPGKTSKRESGNTPKSSAGEPSANPTSAPRFVNDHGDVILEGSKENQFWRTRHQRPIFIFGEDSVTFHDHGNANCSTQQGMVGRELLPCGCCKPELGHDELATFGHRVLRAWCDIWSEKAGKRVGSFGNTLRHLLYECERVPGALMPSGWLLSFRRRHPDECLWLRGIKPLAPRAPLAHEAEVRRTGLFLQGTPDLTGLFVATDASGGPATRDSRLRSVGWAIVVASRHQDDLNILGTMTGLLPAPATVPEGESEAIAQALLSTRGTFDLTCDCRPAIRSLQGTFTKRTPLVWSKAWDHRHRVDPHWAEVAELASGSTPTEPVTGLQGPPRMATGQPFAVTAFGQPPETPHPHPVPELSLAPDNPLEPASAEALTSIRVFPMTRHVRLTTAYVAKRRREMAAAEAAKAKGPQP